MKIFLKIIDTANFWLGKAISYICVVMLVTIVYEVVARYLFNAPSSWVMEYNGYFLCAYAILAGGYTLLNKAHVSVDILYSRFPYRTKSIVDTFTWIMFFIFAGTMTYLGWGMAHESLLRKEVASTILETPLFPVKVLIPLGSALLLLQGVAKFIRDIRTAITGEMPEDTGEGGIFGRMKEK